MTEQNYAALIYFLQTAENLVLTGHQDPDADCVGSLLGLYHGFNGQAKGWRLVLQDEVPANLHYLPGLELIQTPESVLAEPPAAIMLVDCGDIGRAGSAWLEPLRQLPLYCLDHHISNSFVGELAVIKPEASSTGELATDLLEQAGLPISLEAATCLYSAIVADTGCFRYLNTTPHALAIAARLLQLGVDLEQVRINLFESRSLANIAMLAVALNNLQTRCEGRLCYAFVPQSEMQRHGATKQDLHNIINFTLSVVGVKLGIFFEEHDGFVKISLRSRRGWRVDELAVELGGGGHMMAAGCSIPGSLAEVMPDVLQKAEKLLGE